MAQINKDGLGVVTRRQGQPNGNGNGNPLVDYAPSVRVITQGRALSEQSMMVSIGRFDPDRITMKQRRQMAADPMIGLALNFLKVLLIGADYHFESTDPQLVAFLDNCYRRIHAGLISELMQALPYGYAGIVQRFQTELPDWEYEDEKGQLKQVWPEKKIQAVTWNVFQNLPPEGLKPVFQADGKTFDGMEHLSLRQSDQVPGPLRVPVTHSLWYAHGKEQAFGDWYGIPRTRSAFRYWWSYWYQWLLADRHAEQDADPPLVVGVPGEEMVPDPDNPGMQITSQELGMRIGQYLRDGATIVLPTDVYEDAEGKPTGTRKWTADFLRGGENLQAFRSNFEYMDTMKIRGTLVPESALIAGGGRNTMLVAVQSLEKSLEQLSDEIDQLVNDYLIPPLLAQNFVKPASVRKVTTGFREEDLTLPKQILTILTQADPSSLSLDVRKLAHQVGLPLKPAGSQPDVTSPTGNLPALPGQPTPNAAQGGGPQGNNNPAGGFRGPGGQTAQGESAANRRGQQQPPNFAGGGSRSSTSIGGQPAVGLPGGGNLRIDGQPFSFGFSLDGDHQPDPDAAALPQTPHFQDPEVRANAEDLLSVLDGWFTDLYGEAADHVEQHISPAAQQLLGLEWTPDMEPRWPKGTPSVGGRWMRIGDMIDSLAKGGTKDLSFLAHGAQHIESVSATAPNSNTLQFHVKLPDGTHTIDAPRTGEFSHVMDGLRYLDSGRAASAGGAVARGLPGDAPARPGTDLSGKTVLEQHKAYESIRGQSPEIQTTASQLLNDAKVHEPQVTADLKRLARLTGGSMQGLDYRLKRIDRIAEKLDRKSVEKNMPPAQYAETMADSLRYTTRFDAAHYTDGAQRFLAELRKAGYQFADHEVENSWKRDDYRGINMNMRTPDGYAFELQFHTHESLATKDPSHTLYEEYRLLDTPPERKAELMRQIRALWQKVPPPDGVMKIGRDVAPKPEAVTKAADQAAPATGPYVLVQGGQERSFPSRKAAMDVARTEGGKLYRQSGGKRLFVASTVARPDARSATQKKADSQLVKDAAKAGGASPPADGGVKPPLVKLPEPPKLAWREPPKPQGVKGGRKAGGFTATGHTNTALGDLAEKAVRELGLRSLLPAGKRQNPLDAAYGDYGFEIKAVTTAAQEYKAKPKKAEVASKLAYAKAEGLKPGLMIVVYDPAAAEFHAYWTEGIGAYTLTKGRFHFMGTVSEKGLAK